MNGPPGAEEVQEIECPWKVIRGGSAEDKSADPDPAHPPARRIAGPREDRQYPAKRLT